MVYIRVFQELDEVTRIDKSPADFHVIIAISQVFIEASDAYESPPAETHIGARDVEKWISPLAEIA